MSENRNLGFFALIALVIGSMIGGGAFNLPSDMASGAGAGAVLLGWLVTGLGMIALALSFQNLSMRKPELDGGVYSYARAGFGEYIGFNSAWGYWLSAWLGNVSYATFLFGTLSFFIPIFNNDGNNWASVIVSSLLILGINYLVLRGVKEASIVNIITTIAKMVPIILFIVLGIFAFKADIFSSEMWSSIKLGGSSVGLFDQVTNTLMVTLWVFIGVEGAVVVSGRAKNRADIGKATVVGLLLTLVVYAFITTVSYGILPRAQLADLPKPTMAGVLAQVIGPAGAVLVRLGLALSLLGATLGWTLLAAEIPYVAAKDGVFPRLFARETENKSPGASLWITNILVIGFIIYSHFSQSSYVALYYMSGTAIILPYLFSALYQVKLAITGEDYHSGENRNGDLLKGLIAVIYAVWLVYAAGMDYLLMVSILYAPGFIFYLVSRREEGKKATSSDWILALIITGFAIYALILMARGVIAP